MSQDNQILTNQDNHPILFHHLTGLFWCYCLSHSVQLVLTSPISCQKFSYFQGTCYAFLNCLTIIFLVSGAVSVSIVLDNPPALTRSTLLESVFHIVKRPQYGSIHWYYSELWHLIHIYFVSFGKEASVWFHTLCDVVLHREIWYIFILYSDIWYIFILYFWDASNTCIHGVYFPWSTQNIIL